MNAIKTLLITGCLLGAVALSGQALAAGPTYHSHTEKSSQLGVALDSAPMSVLLASSERDSKHGSKFDGKRGDRHDKDFKRDRKYEHKRGDRHSGKFDGRRHDGHRDKWRSHGKFADRRDKMHNRKFNRHDKRRR